MSNDTEVDYVKISSDAFEDCRFELYRFGEECEAVTAELHRFRLELALVLGLKSYETRRLPADLIFLLDGLDELVSAMGSRAYQLCGEMVDAVAAATDPGPTAQKEVVDAANTGERP